MILKSKHSTWSAQHVELGHADMIKFILFPWIYVCKYYELWSLQKIQMISLEIMTHANNQVRLMFNLANNQMGPTLVNLAYSDGAHAWYPYKYS